MIEHSSSVYMCVCVFSSVLVICHFKKVGAMDVARYVYSIQGTYYHFPFGKLHLVPFSLFGKSF